MLMMEDRRKASEGLFGDLMNFQAGPTQGQEADRLRSAIQWMETEFLRRLQDYLTADQFAAWSRARESAIAAASGPREQTLARQQNQTQYVRINNNAFTGEDNGYRLFNRASDRVNTAATEVIQRGGVGAWHGNIEFFSKKGGSFSSVFVQAGQFCRAKVGHFSRAPKCRSISVPITIRCTGVISGRPTFEYLE